MNKLSIGSYVFAIFALSLAACNTVETKAPELSQSLGINITVPSRVDGHPGIIPVSVDLNSALQDPIAEVVINVPSNSAQHQSALRLKLTNPQSKIVVNTRVRAEASGEARVQVVAITKNGRSSSQEKSLKGVVDAVDFSNEATLSVFFEQESNLFPRRQIGERNIVFTKLPGGLVDIGALIYHPNFPDDVGVKANSLDRIMAYVDSRLVFTADIESALSNNTLLKVALPKDAIGNGTSLLVRWSDKRGKNYESKVNFGSTSYN